MSNPELDQQYLDTPASKRELYDFEERLIKLISSVHNIQFDMLEEIKDLIRLQGGSK